MPLVGLDLSSGARAGLTAFMAGVARSVAGIERHHQLHAAGHLRHRPLRSNVEMTAKKRGTSFDAGRPNASPPVPARRFGQPDEFGATCAFLCSAQAGYITGQNLLIDGGRSPARSEKIQQN